MCRDCVIGASWCHDTTRTRKQLDSLGVEYDYVDIDEDPSAEEWIKKQNNGKRMTPTVDVNGKLLFEPSNEDMQSTLKSAGYL